MPFYSDYFAINLLAVLLAGLRLPLLRQGKGHHYKTLYWVVSIALLVAAGTYAGLSSHLPDFRDAYYPAGQRIIQDPANLYRSLCGGFVNLPVIALLFTPLTLVTIKTAMLVFLVAGYIGTFLVSVALLGLSRTRGHEQILLLGLIAINGPMDYNLWVGNITQFVLLILIAGFFLLDRKREFAAGLCFGAAGLLKLPLLLLPVYFLVKKRWNATLGAAAITGGVLLLSLLLYGIGLNLHLLEGCILPLSEQPISAINMQSLNGFLARFLYPGSDLFSWDPFTVDMTFRITRYLFLAFIYGLTFLAILVPDKANQDSTRIDLSLLLLCALIVSPVSWSHYYLLLLLPISFCLGGRMPLWQLSNTFFLLFFAAVLLVSLPQDLGVWLFHRLGGGSMARLAVSYYLYGALLLWLYFLAVRLRAPSNNSSTRNTPIK